MLKEKDRQTSSGAHRLSVQVNHIAFRIMEFPQIQSGLKITMPKYTEKLLEAEVP